MRAITLLKSSMISFASNAAKVMVATVVGGCALTASFDQAQCDSDNDSLGCWTPSTAFNWGMHGQHVALLRGPGSYHSCLMLFGEDSGGEVWIWRWNPGTELGSPLDTLRVTPPGYNPDCAGHSTLADGRLLLSGGQGGSGGALIGTSASRIFDPTTTSWSSPSPPDMEFPRFYPTNTTLPSGAALISSGSTYRHLVSFGGTDGAAEKSDLHAVLGLDAVPDTAGATSSIGGSVPTAREGHSAVFDASVTSQPTYPPGYPDFQRVVLFGGRTGGTPLNDLWELRRDEVNGWWTGLQLPTDSPPPARSQHSANYASSSTPKTMVVYGGLGTSGSILGDVWTLTLAGAGTSGTWSPVNAGGTVPPPRYAHSAIYQSGSPPRLVVWGGRLPGEALSDTVWSLSLPTPGSPAWSVLATGGPSKRESHVAILDGSSNSMIIFGGKDSSGLCSDVWKLTLSGTPAWSPLSPQGDPVAGTPSARIKHAAIYDPEFKRMVVVGGDTLDGAGGLASDVWTLALPATGSPSWTRHYASLPSGGRAGHAAVFDPRLANVARVPELFTTATNQIQKVHSAALYQPFYPFLFVLPSGRLFWAGPGTTTRILDANASLPSWGPAKASQGPGGSAVMYAPGKILKTGGHSGYFYLPPSNTTERVDLSGSEADSSWIQLERMDDPRIEHNLTVLPTGDVLVSGGYSEQINVLGSSVGTPQLWSPTSGQWSELLRDEGTVRNYHSTAILLPDARLLSAGGRYAGQPPPQADHLTARIFSPPYLFKSNGDLAARPVITDAPQRIHYGKNFSICMPYLSYGQKACLIRPGAVTHGFDQNQRFVPLAIVDSTLLDYGQRRVVAAPADAFVAPPGDYLLFILDQHGVPAVARWVRVGSEWNSGDGTPPATPSDFFAEIVEQTAITLTWTAPGDDGQVGQAWQYDLRYSLSPSTPFAQMDSLSGPASCTGLAQSHRIAGLQPCTYYYFAMRMADESNNWSGITPIASARTACVPGGGGGGARAAESGSREEFGATSATRGSAGFEASASNDPSGLLVAELQSSQGTRTWTIAHADSETIAGLGPADTAYAIVQSVDPEVGWRTRLRFEDADGALGIRSLHGSRSRVVFRAPYAIREVEVSPRGFTLTSAAHNRMGDLLADSSSGVITSPDLGKGDTLVLAYRSAEAGPETEADCFLLLTGGRSVGGLRGKGLENAALPVPLRFGLGQNRPNPFDKTTRIEFILPRPSLVKLEVFDMAGRRVRTVVEAHLEAGVHDVTWDRRGSDGAMARSGVYWYRITAGWDRDQKMMVLLP